MAQIVLKKIEEKPLTEFKRNLDDGTWPAKGEWRACRGQDKKLYANMCCPGCGETYGVGGISHQIAPDGAVTPSVVCNTPGCGYHEMIRLMGWVARS